MISNITTEIKFSPAIVIVFCFCWLSFELSTLVERSPKMTRCLTQKHRIRTPTDPRMFRVIIIAVLISRYLFLALPALPSSSLSSLLGLLRYRDHEWKMNLHYGPSNVFILIISQLLNTNDRLSGHYSFTIKLKKLMNVNEDCQCNS